VDTAQARMGAARERNKLALDQLRLTLRNLQPNYWLMPVFGAIVCVMFARWLDVRTLASWFAMLAIGGMPLGAVAHRFLHADQKELEARHWIALGAGAYFLFATSWSSMALFFWAPHNDFNHMLLMLLIACTLAGNSALVGASKPLAIIGYAVYGLALILTPLREGGLIYDGLSALAFLFVGYLAYMSRQIYFTARDMLMLRDDKNELIEALAASKSESDAARDRAEAASRAKSQFLANMSHELRTPLNAILGFSEMIHSGAFGADIGKHREYAHIIHDSGHHLLGLINDILDLAKIEAGALALRESDVDLTLLIGDSVKLMAAKAQAGGLRLQVRAAPGLPAVFADERALKQISLNLLSNSVKFTPAGGEVVAFARFEDDGSVAFGVRDTGVGIEEEDREHVFQSFGQGRHDVVTADKGTGLGLPIVKGLVEAHGGRVALESVRGAGTCVTVWLPKERVRANEAARAAS
jgi:two-component system, cell cycle sensor histidine kinase PleC